MDYPFEAYKLFQCPFDKKSYILHSNKTMHRFEILEIKHKTETASYSEILRRVLKYIAVQLSSVLFFKVWQSDLEIIFDKRTLQYAKKFRFVNFKTNYNSACHSISV